MTCQAKEGFGLGTSAFKAWLISGLLGSGAEIARNCGSSPLK